jgi:hypothetical protein
MERSLQGHYVTRSTVGERVQAFVPSPLPPNPPLVWSPELRERFDQALLALGRLDSVSILLPDTSLFLYMYIRKEAVLSSQTYHHRATQLRGAGHGTLFTQNNKARLSTVPGWCKSFPK